MLKEGDRFVIEDRCLRQLLEVQLVVLHQLVIDDGAGRSLFLQGDCIYVPAVQNVRN